MICETLTTPGADHRDIPFRSWSADPTSNPTYKGVVHLLHGMAEHSGRYAPLAKELVSDGYILIAHDHRGHGASTFNEKELGHFSDTNGWNLVIGDVLSINGYIKNQYPQLPIILFGHSMGSFIALQYLQLYGSTVNQVTLSGATFNNALLSQVVHGIARMERLRIGKRGRSKLIQKLAFGRFNKPFEPSRTEFDWLSDNPEEVDNYISDPLCGGISTTQLWVDLTSAFTHIFKPHSFQKMPSRIPYYVFSGECDPVQAPKGSDQLMRAMRQAGITNIKHHIFSNGRHETLNDTNRKEVISELLSWLNQ
ncbi:MAG: alpha/beta hydrolase [Pseudomonadales bacterium]|nr:alpha/beta hydrolase [Pseudomonadales bacterium]